MTLRIYLLCSVAFLAFSQQAKAANGSVNITGNQTSIYVTKLPYILLRTMLQVQVLILSLPHLIPPHLKKI